MRIALTYTGDETKHMNYVRWLNKVQDVELLRLSAEEENLEQLKECDGLLLSGGVDIFPTLYGSTQMVYPNMPERFREDRDRFEIEAYHAAQSRGLPVLGVCRGLQLINCIHGGNLVQDLGPTLNKIHRFEENDKAHGVSIEAGSLLAQITKQDRAVVNSAHHQAVNEIGKGLRVSCRADDGTIEGLELAEPTGKSFLLCIQWHPERMFKLGLEESPFSAAIRDAFCQAIKKRIA